MENREAIKIINQYDMNFHWNDGEPIPSEQLAEAFDLSISALKKQEADRWHSVAKEGNPPKIGYYLWSARGGNVDIDFYDGEKWEKASKYLYEVLAWKYRSEPYTEEKA